MTKKHVDFLIGLGACEPAVGYAEKHRSLKSAWDNCNRPEWMLWLLDKINYQDDKAYRLYACWCVRNTPLADGRKVWDLLTDPRSKTAVEVAEKYATGMATSTELDAARAAGYAARDAAGDAWAAGYAAWAAGDARAARDAAWAAGDAAWAAGYAAWAAGDAWAARYAARAAGYAAWAARDAAGAAGDAWAARDAAGAAGDAQVDQLRVMFPWPRVARCISAMRSV